MVGQRGWPKGRPCKAVRRSVVAVAGRSKASKGVNLGDLPDSSVCSAVSGEGDSAAGLDHIGDSIAQQSPVSLEKVLGDELQEGELCPSWADRCEKESSELVESMDLSERVVDLHHDSPQVLGKGVFLRVLTQGVEGRAAQTTEDQKFSLEGNRALCNGLMLFQRKVWRPIRKDSLVNVVPSCSVVEVAGGTLMENVGLGVDCEHPALVGGAEEDASLCEHGKWQAVKGKAVARSTPRHAPVQVSASRFSPLVPGCSDNGLE
ncbi:hypothetical protein Dimus_002434 [Dionaea muscipula]